MKALLGAAAAAAVLAACAFGGGESPQPHSPAAVRRGDRDASSGKIEHVVIIVQENRSFNDLFYGFPGAKTVKYGLGSKNRRLKIIPVPLEATWDIDHSADSFFAACNGTGSIPGTDCRMNGFDRERVGCGYVGGRCPNKHPQYAYVPHAETKPYFDIAQRYVLADQMYASNFDSSSFVSHQYIIAGQAQSSVDYPFGSYWGCPGGPNDDVDMVGPQRQVPSGQEVACWNPPTLGDELDDAGISWAYYASAIGKDEGSIWSAYQAIKHVYDGPDWTKDVISPQQRFFTDVAKGKLRSVSWVTPTFTNSDHAGSDSNTGPSWVASLVNAIGESPYWDSTAIFIFWDDYGGWYDPEPPAYADYDGLGLRIPMLIVSPYAKKGRVSHVHYEHGSILKFVEDTFGLQRLAASDTRAASPQRDAFDFNRPPRAFVPIGSPHGEAYFERQAVDRRIPDAQ